MDMEKEIKIVNDGEDGKDLDISPVYDHIISPHTDEENPRNVIIPNQKKEKKEKEEKEEKEESEE